MAKIQLKSDNINPFGGLIVGVENRDGNANVKFHQADTLERIFTRLKTEAGVLVENFRADCGSFSEDILRMVSGHCEHFYIRANNCQSRRTEFMEHGDWTEVTIGGQRCGDQLRSVIWTLEEDQVTVILASADLDDQLNSILEISWVIEWTLDDTRELLEKLEGKKFTVQLDDQSIEAVKGIHSEVFANKKKLIEKAQQRMEKMLSQHREKLKGIKDGESVWLSFKAWVWAIIIIEVSLLLVGIVVYYIAKAKLT